MEGQGYRVGAGEGRGWSARAAVGPPSTLYKGENGGSERFEKVGPLLQVLGFGGGGGAEEGGDHLPGTFGAPVPLVGDVKSSPTARGRKPRLDRKTRGAKSTVGAPTDVPGGGFQPRTRHSAVR